MNTPNPSTTVVRTHRLTLTLTLALALIAILAYQQPATAAPLGTVLTYQGRITDGGEPINGTIDLQLILGDAEIGGNALALQLINDVPVVDGVFSVEIDFGSNQFNGDARWLTIGVRSGTAPDTDPYEFLDPRQPITATPYSQLAVKSLNADAVTGIDGHSLDAADGAPVDALFVANNGDIGIGTTTPAESVHIVASSDAELRVENTGSGTAGVSFANADREYIVRMTGSENFTIRDQTVTTDRFTIDTAGFVGIGTTTPGAPLSVVTANSGIRAANASDEAEYTEMGHGGSNGFINTVGDGNLNFRHDGNTFMTLADTGYLGIGVANPETPLSIANGGLPFGMTQGQMGANGMELTTRDASGGQPTRLLIAAGVDNPSIHFLGGARTAETIHTSFESNGVGGQMRMVDAAGVNRLRGRAVGDGGEFQIYDTAGNDMATVDVVANGGRLLLTDAAGVNRVNVQATSNGGQLKIFEPTGGERVRAYVNPVDCGDIQTFGPNGNVNTWLTNLADNPDHGWMGVYDSTGTVRAGMYVEPDGDGFMFTDVIKINGGSDLAEPFDVITDRALQPGMVVAIDPERVGKLRVSTESYDRTVAGIISGAGGVKPGLMMGQKGTVADGEHPVALTGRVYCWVDADAAGAVRAGDLLTTSDTPGHAMRVTDHSRAAGAILGKAMSSLESGRGLVLVLVSLQ